MRKYLKRAALAKIAVVVVSIVTGAILESFTGAYFTEVMRPHSELEVVPGSINMVPLYAAPIPNMSNPVMDIRSKGVYEVAISYAVKNNGKAVADRVSTIIKAPDNWMSPVDGSSVVVGKLEPISVGEPVLEIASFVPRDRVLTNHGSFSVEIQLQWDTGRSQPVHATITW